MDLKSQAKYEARARIIKAMAHPTRLFIVDELARTDERCVCELTEMVGVDMSTISRHLAMLKKRRHCRGPKTRSTGVLQSSGAVRIGLL